MELTGGTFRSELHDVVANDEHAVWLFAARGQREGKTLDARNVLVTHVRNGKLGETWLFSGISTRPTSSWHGCFGGVPDRRRGPRPDGTGAPTDPGRATPGHR